MSRAIWTSQPGPQALASVTPFDLTFYGGTRGGGKSDTVIGRNVAGAHRWGQKWHALILRRKFRDFAEMRRRWDELILQGLPAERIGGDTQSNFIKFANGAIVTMAAVVRQELLGSFQGHSYCEIDIDEAPEFPFVANMIEKLKACLRSAAGVPCHMFLTGNPGGVGASIIKEMFVSHGNCRPYVDEAGFSHVYIRSTLFDNAILCQNDPKYVQRLLSIKDPLLRRAWLYGDWDVAIGQAFTFNHRHVIAPIPVPSNAPIYMTFDWGFGAPFSVGWWWVDADGRIYRFAEWYGTDPKIPGEGLRMTDQRIAIGIREREEKLGIHMRPIVRLAGHDCFNAKPDYKGGGQGPTTAEVFAEYGVHLSMGDSTRAKKIRQFRNRLEIPESAIELPMLVAYDTCKHFIRVIPALAVDEDNIEDIDTDQEDHIYDEACHICMARPIKGEATDLFSASLIDKAAV